MGYSSDLYFKSKKEALPGLMAVLLKHDLTQYIETFNNDAEYCYLTITDVKWYSGSDTDDVEKYIEEHGDSMAMIRKGEDSADLSVYGNPYEVEMDYSLILDLDGFDYGTHGKDNMTRINEAIEYSKKKEPELFI